MVSLSLSLSVQYCLKMASRLHRSISKTVWYPKKFQVESGIPMIMMHWLLTFQVRIVMQRLCAERKWVLRWRGSQRADQKIQAASFQGIWKPVQKLIRIRRLKDSLYLFLRKSTSWPAHHPQILFFWLATGRMMLFRCVSVSVTQSSRGDYGQHCWLTSCGEPHQI